MFELLFAGRVRGKQRDMLGITSQPGTVGLLGLERQVLASKDVGQPGDSLMCIHGREDKQ